MLVSNRLRQAWEVIGWHPRRSREATLQPWVIWRSQTACTPSTSKKLDQGTLDASKRELWEEGFCNAREYLAPGGKEGKARCGVWELAIIYRQTASPVVTQRQEEKAAQKPRQSRRRGHGGSTCSSWALLSLPFPSTCRLHNKFLEYLKEVNEAKPKNCKGLTFPREGTKADAWEALFLKPLSFRSSWEPVIQAMIEISQMPLGNFRVSTRTKFVAALVIELMSDNNE